MTGARIALWARRWFTLASAANAAKGFLEGLGFLLMLTKATELFFPSAHLNQLLASNWGWLLGLAGLIYSVWRGWPPTLYSAKLKGKDVRIDITLGNIFDVDGAVVVPTNTTFDTRLPQLQSEKSIQGYCANKFYDSLDHLDLDLKNGLEKYKHQPTKKIKVQEPRKRLLYELGTVVPTQAKGRKFYWFAMSRITDNERAEALPEDVRSALPVLWNFVCDKGDKGVVATPLVGTGFARSGLTRESAAKEIVRSFIAANSMKTFCDRLVIVIHPEDCIKNEIDIEKLADFVKHECEHLEVPASGKPVGEPVPAEPNPQTPKT